MKYLLFNVTKQTVSRTKGDDAQIVSGSLGYYGIQVDFDEESLNIPGMKSAEFFKEKHSVMVDLVDGKCVIPDDMLKTATPFELRIICGNVTTTWTSISVAAGGVIPTETPDEPQDGTAYVKSVSGENAVAMLRTGNNGLEYSANGVDFEPGVNGVPDAPRGKDKLFARTNGDWINLEGKLLTGGSPKTIVPLDAAAELTATVEKVNEILAALAAQGIIS